MLNYRYDLKRYGDECVITFPDVPEAMTSAPANNYAEDALDVLVTALAGYAKEGRAVPRPQSSASGRTISVPILLAAKLALIAAMAKQNMTQATLADRLQCDQRAVRRLIDLNHRSHIGEVERALLATGKALDLKVRSAA